MGTAVVKRSWVLAAVQEVWGSNPAGCHWFFQAGSHRFEAGSHGFEKEEMESREEMEGEW